MVCIKEINDEKNQAQVGHKVAFVQHREPQVLLPLEIEASNNPNQMDIEIEKKAWSPLGLDMNANKSDKAISKQV